MAQHGSNKKQIIPELPEMDWEILGTGPLRDGHKDWLMLSIGSERLAMASGTNPL